MKTFCEVFCSMIVGLSLGIGIAIPAPSVHQDVLRGAEVRPNVHGGPITHPGRKKRHFKARFHQKSSFAAPALIVVDRSKVSVIL